MAERAGMSRTSFAVKFREMVGAAPMAYLAGWRMLRAADRLAHSTAPVSAIARDLGYESESAFSTAFKRVMGCSPRQYARQRTASIGTMPVGLDQRGVARHAVEEEGVESVPYPISGGGIHPQMDDPSKALLEFAHGLLVGPARGYWLAIHIANLFDVDRVSFTDRVKWTCGRVLVDLYVTFSEMGPEQCFQQECSIA